MESSKSTIIFSEKPITPVEQTENEAENKKISYWLEKLHIQRDQIKNDAKSTEQSRSGSIGQSFKNKFKGSKDADLTQSGINENTKNAATKRDADRQMVNELVKRSNRRIISISSIFPWDLFPTTIVVEEGRVTFHFHQLFSSQSHSVDIKDISNVFIETSIFFATLQIVSRTYIQNDIKIGKLNKTKARKVQRIIEGLRTFAEHDINTSDYSINELISKIEELHRNREAK